MAVQRHSTGSGRITERTSTAPSHFLADVLHGLAQSQKSIPCKYFYDEAGSALFDAICETPEYYPTRTELAIMATHAPEIGEALGRNCQVVELGSGSSLKTRRLLEHLPRPAAYVPVDISGEHLRKSADSLARRFPELDVTPVAADFTRPFDVPALHSSARRVIYFPGSTIGNFPLAEAASLLERTAALAGRGGSLLIGIDLVKDPAILDAAYNDRRGTTAAFNRNLLVRINRELGADFDLGAFRHFAFYNPAEGRVEMHLRSEIEQTVHLAGRKFRFRVGETIHTENSHKYRVEDFRKLASNAGWRSVAAWADLKQFFSVQLFEAISIGSRNG